MSDWRNDPSADDRWNAGLDYGQRQLCAVLSVDPQSVSWDAATETLDGDVQSVICNILRAWAGDDWQDVGKPSSASPASPMAETTDAPVPAPGEIGRLWCMHVQGPDEVHAAPDFWTALAWATELNAFIVKRAIKGRWAKDDMWPLTQAVVKRWPGTAEGHAALLKEELAARAAHEAKKGASPAGSGSCASVEPADAVSPASGSGNPSRIR